MSVLEAMKSPGTAALVDGPQWPVKPLPRLLALRNGGL
jgi:hypothetical protein